MVLLVHTMENECALPGETDFGLLCTENREFLYNGDGITTPASLTSADSLQGFDEDEHNMASSFGESSLANSTFSSKTSCSSVNDGDKPKKVRKRNSVRDKMRSAAEQSAYRKLREVIPTLDTVKKPTKLQTIRHTLKFIERLQNKLDELEGQNTTNGESSEVREKEKKNN